MRRHEEMELQAIHSKLATLICEAALNGLGNFL